MTWLILGFLIGLLITSFSNTNSGPTEVYERRDWSDPLWEGDGGRAR